MTTAAERRVVLISELKQGRWPMTTAPTLSSNDLSRLIIAGAFETRTVTIGAKEALDMSMRVIAGALERGVIHMETFDVKDSA